jgi:hypothetical protein
MLLGGYHLVLRDLRHSKAGREATNVVRNSAQLKTMLGEPFKLRIEAGEVDLDQGNAHFSFDTQGPRGEADVDLTLKKEGSTWRFASGSVQTDEGVLPFDGK